LTIVRLAGYGPHRDSQKVKPSGAGEAGLFIPPLFIAEPNGRNKY
jgi:hypothetical protein